MDQTTATAHQPAQHLTIDECVRLVTSFDGWSDLTSSLPTYAPKFYGRPTTTLEVLARRRVVSAFNAFAERSGRAVRAFDVFAKGAL